MGNERRKLEMENMGNCYGELESAERMGEDGGWKI